MGNRALSGVFFYMGNLKGRTQITDGGEVDEL